MYLVDGKYFFDRYVINVIIFGVKKRWLVRKLILYIENKNVCIYREISKGCSLYLVVWVYRVRKSYLFRGYEEFRFKIIEDKR